MRTPLTYFLLGAVFTYFAYVSMTDTVWNVTTILLLLLASLEFTIGFRFLVQIINKNNENHKN